MRTTNFSKVHGKGLSSILCPFFLPLTVVALRLDTYSVVSKALGRNSLVKAGLASCCTADNSAAMYPFFDSHLHFKQSCCIFIAGVWLIFWLQRCTVLVCSTSLSIRDTLHVVLFSTPLQDPCTSGCQRRSPNAQRRLLRWMGKSLKFSHVRICTLCTPVPSSSNGRVLISMWVCLKIGYIPNYSHLIGIMIINHWV